MRLLPTYLTLLALVAALALGLAGCSGGFAPTLPSPNGGEGEGDTAMSTVTPAQGGVEVLPSDLTKSSFKVTLDGAEATVRSAAYGASGGKLAISFIIDSTGSMSGTLEGVLSSIQAFGDSLTGREITWQGSEYGDASPADGINTWDFFGDERVVDVHIRSIRKLLGDSADTPELIGTVRGVGYKFLGVAA